MPPLNADLALDTAIERELIAWIETPAQREAARLAGGYQGTTYLYQTATHRLIIKVALGRGLRGYFSRWTLQREYAAYQCLQGFAGVPRCYGLLHGRYLVLDYVPAKALRDTSINDHTTFFDTLLSYLQELHARGVAHADLKRKDNLLVIDGRLPCLIDFGAAIVRKPGFAPLNHYLFGLAQRFDYNAWAKLKYDGRFDRMTATDRVYYQRTTIEHIARAIKRFYLALRGKFVN